MCSKLNKIFKFTCFWYDSIINKSKILTNHISCKCKRKFDGRNCNPNQKWNKNKCCCECQNPKEYHMYERRYVCNPAPYNCENRKYTGSIIDITYDGIIEETKFIQTKAIPLKSTSTKSVLTKCTSAITVLTKCISAKIVLTVLLVFLSTTIALLIVVSIYPCLIKYQAKQRPFL